MHLLLTLHTTRRMIVPFIWITDINTQFPHIVVSSKMLPDKKQMFIQSLNIIQT